MARNPKMNSINEQLFSCADSVRKQYVGDEVHLRGLIEFSNICKRTCKYCGLRYENKNIDRYRISESKKLLKSGLYSVGEVAFMMGFSNEFYFSRIYKKFEGVAPSFPNQEKRNDDALRGYLLIRL